jgi:hypothetical protein
MFPSPDIIGIAIVAAARALAPSNFRRIALEVPRGRKDVGSDASALVGFPLARTRSYAAYALWEVFPKASRTGIARCVGQGYADVWATAFPKNLREGKLPWWDDDIYETVRDAVIRAIENPAPSASAG